MLSVLIPVYNFNVVSLVTTLDKQCREAAIPYEILCFDDGSPAAFHEAHQKAFSSMPQVRYSQLPENVGRSRIRNLLAEAAQFDYLLFMDCDSGVVSEQYIQQYLEHLQPAVLLYGGRIYQDFPPEQAQYFFHWYYGRNREQVPADERKKQPYHSFMTNNFLIARRIFLEIRFDESLREYGHEDTLFGLELQLRKVLILHLNNPLKHLGLEEQAVFLQKSNQAIINLYRIAEKHPQLSTRLLDTFRKVKRLGLAQTFRWLLNQLHPFLLRGLRPPKPNLLYFDLYKLSLLLNEDRDSQKNDKFKAKYRT